MQYLARSSITAQHFYFNRGLFFWFVEVMDCLRLSGRPQHSVVECLGIPEVEKIGVSASGCNACTVDEYNVIDRSGHWHLVPTQCSWKLIEGLCFL